MDLQSNLIESQKKKSRGRWKQLLLSLMLHGAIIGGIVFLSVTSTHRVDAEDRAMRAFMMPGSAPPPPPPPPPPAASHTPQATPHPTVKVQVPQQSFVQPREIPQEIPKVEPVTTTETPVNVPQASSAAEDTGQPGGVPGGVAGGVVGGVQGGVVGGTVGGQLGGKLGGQVGGTGTEVAPDANGPLHVGGAVSAPVVTKRVEPSYTELARKSRVAGVVIVEAVIDKEGNVDQVKVVRGLPMGLSEEAERAVKQWKFRPGQLNGAPVDVIFNLVVNFTLNASNSSP